ncbi:hypothetical protein F5X98DRAFT_27852 [Xylaria grammica]|nr:hypothetical protein F5X98DRAFT_27852 [Xylaria grammica]
MDLGSFRAHQLPSLSLFLVFNISKSKICPLAPIADCRFKVSVAHSFENQELVYILCSVNVCYCYSTMKEHLDSNRVNFLIWRYAVTRFPSPVPILTSLHFTSRRFHQGGIFHPPGHPRHPSSRGSIDFGKLGIY